MLLICAAVGEEAERKQAAVDANIVAQQIRMGTGICSVSFEQAKQRASKALCSAALMGKWFRERRLSEYMADFGTVFCLNKLALLQQLSISREC